MELRCFLDSPNLEVWMMNGRKKQMLIAAGLAIASMTSLAVQSTSAADKEAVAYRLAEWKTIEFKDPNRAKVHFSTIKKLGCEVKQADHNGHVDVSYRCPKWRQIELSDHAAAHKWEDWLKASGFETQHKH